MRGTELLISRVNKLACKIRSSFFLVLQNELGPMISQGANYAPVLFRPWLTPLAVYLAQMGLDETWPFVFEPQDFWGDSLSLGSGGEGIELERGFVGEWFLLAMPVSCSSFPKAGPSHLMEQHCLTEYSLPRALL